MYKTVILLACLLASAGAEYTYKVSGGDEDNHGILVIMDDKGDWGVVCDDEFGHNEVMAVCRTLGSYTAGTVVSSSSYEDQELDFVATTVKCPVNSDDVDDCEWTEYEKTDVPCSSREAVAVSCSKSAFEVKMDVKRYKLNEKKNTARVQLNPEIKKYGIEYNIKMFHSKVKIFNRVSKTEYNSIANLTFKKNKGYFRGRVKNVKTVVCAVAVVRIDNQPKVVNIIDCDDKKVTEDTVKMELTDLWKDG